MTEDQVQVNWGLPAHLVWGDLDANHYSKEQRKQTLEDIEGFEE